MAKQFIASSKLPLKFYIDAGLFEFDSNGTGGGILETSRNMRDVLLAKGYEVQVHYQQFVGGHDYLSSRGTFAEGLMDLIGITCAIWVSSKLTTTPPLACKVVSGQMLVNNLLVGVACWQRDQRLSV